MNIVDLIWVLFWAQLAIINCTREIIYYGLKGQDIPFISYWGYFSLFIMIMVMPTIGDKIIIYKKWRQ